MSQTGQLHSVFLAQLNTWANLTILMQRQRSRKSKALPFSYHFHPFTSAEGLIDITLWQVVKRSLIGTTLHHGFRCGHCLVWGLLSLLLQQLLKVPQIAACSLMSAVFIGTKHTEPVTGTVSGIVNARKSLHQDSAIILSFLEHHQATKCSGSCLSLQREAGVLLQ